MNTKFFFPASVLALLTVVTLATGSLRKSVDVAHVDFKTECTTVSDPQDAALFLHEDIVNSFLTVNDKFGHGRMMRMPYIHERFAQHGGTSEVPRDWKDKTTAYKLADWGMVGGIEDHEPLRVYYLKRQFPLLVLEKEPIAKLVPAAKDDEKALAEINDREADAFEAYAVEELKKGEKLVRWERPEFVRFVGAIRAATSCLRCHTESKVGDVLGAFAYDFTKETLPPGETQNQVVKAARDRAPMKKLVVLKRKELESQMGADMKKPPVFARQTLEYRVRQELLTFGVVLTEMVETQRDTRREVLKQSNQLKREPSPAAMASAKAKGVLKEAEEK